jgi:putative colanic acid biosynthesis acetyltransferase WcaF
VCLGENCWIDKMDIVTIGNNVCISQGALLLTGNHDYTMSSFDYRNAPIVLDDGVWIGAKSIVSLV